MLIIIVSFHHLVKIITNNFMKTFWLNLNYLFRSFLTDIIKNLIWFRMLTKITLLLLVYLRSNGTHYWWIHLLIRTLIIIWLKQLIWFFITVLNIETTQFTLLSYKLFLFILLEITFINKIRTIENKIILFLYFSTKIN